MICAKGLTVKELKKECEKLIASGNGDKHIQISTDDEGNGFHTLFYSFVVDENDVKAYYDDGYFHDNFSEEELKNIVILG